MEAHIAAWRTFAVAGLALYLGGLAVAFGLRGWLHYRRTGDWGIRRISSDGPLLGRLGALLFGASLALGAVGLVVGVAAPAWRLPASDAAAWTGVVVCAVGLVGVLASQFAMGSSWRVGVDPTERTELVTSGVFAWVRNPIFTAMGVTLLGLALMVPNALLVLATVLFIVGVQLQVRVVEEAYLLKTHGDDYLRYARRTGRFLPGIGRLP